MLRPRCQFGPYFTQVNRLRQALLGRQIPIVGPKLGDRLVATAGRGRVQIQCSQGKRLTHCFKEAIEALKRGRNDISLDAADGRLGGPHSSCKLSLVDPMSQARLANESSASEMESIRHANKCRTYLLCTARRQEAGRRSFRRARLAGRRS